jgi:hypothetical protein
MRFQRAKTINLFLEPEEQEEVDPIGVKHDKGNCKFGARNDSW